MRLTELSKKLTLGYFVFLVGLFEVSESFVPSASRVTTTIPSVTSQFVTQRGDDTVWKWEGHDICTRVVNKNEKGLPKVLLIHGFGCSTTYWRATIETLTNDGYEVHALDLLGQGYSSKPSSVYYSINLWSKLVDDYVTTVMAPTDENSNGVVLMGNSLGSLVALATATGDHYNTDTAVMDKSGLTSRIQGICMFNCANGLNSKGTANEPSLSQTSRAIFTALYAVLELLIFRNKLLLSYVLDNIVTKDLLKDTLQNLYIHDPSRVDDELVDSLYNPAKSTGAVDALSQIYSNDAGLNPMDLHAKHSDLLTTYTVDNKPLPIHLVWGDNDFITPLDGGVAKFYKQLAKDKDSTAISFDIVNSGHVPFDDNPEPSNGSMLKWLNTLSKPKQQDNGINMDKVLSFFGLN